MIPTQPNVPNPFELPATNTGNMYKCYGCGQWIANMQYHNCPGPGWEPVKTVPYVPTTYPDMSSGGMMSELMMYSDFKKLIKRDTLAKFRERFLTHPDLLKLEVRDLDTIIEVFDNVAKGFHDDNSV